MTRNKLTEDDKVIIRQAYKARFPAKATATLINRRRRSEDEISLSTIHYQYSLLKAADTPQLTHIELVERIFNEA